MDINFDSSKRSFIEVNYDSDEDEDGDQINFDVDPHQDKSRVFHYRIIVPPFHPGSRRNFKDFEEIPKDDCLQYDLPPSEEFMDNLRGLPLNRARTQSAFQARKENKKSRRPKSQPNLDSIIKKTTFESSEVENAEEEGVERGIEMSLADALDGLSTNTSTNTSHLETKDKYLRPKTVVVATKDQSRKNSPRPRSRTISNGDATTDREQGNYDKSGVQIEVETIRHPSHSSIGDNVKNKLLKPPGGHKLLKRTQSADGVKTNKLPVRRLSVDERTKTHLSRKDSSEVNSNINSETRKLSVAKESANQHNSRSSTRNLENVKPAITVAKSISCEEGKTHKLLARRASMDEGIKIYISKPEQDVTAEEQTESEEDLDAQISESVDLLPDDVNWTELISRTTLPNHEENITVKKPSRRQSEFQMRSTHNNTRKQTDETSLRKRTGSFNSAANSQNLAKGRRKSTASHLDPELERKYKLSSNETIYDARPDKALSKGYTTMQMTIRGKQVRICVPKFSKDDVIDRARAKTAAQMADDRTRGHHTVKEHKVQTKHALK